MPKMNKLIHDFAEDHALINQALDNFLSGNSHLMQAMRYAVLDGGKRLRPLLLMKTAESLGAEKKLTLAPACAIEMIHAYSLIHDDLPAMDNDDFRRGRPSTHKAFDEATAILAGDALQTWAFATLVSAEDLSENCRLHLIRLLSEAAGANGLCLGQDLDLNQRPANIEALENIHRLKTGALIKAAILMGASIAGKNEPAFATLGDLIGLAFQIQDDVFDDSEDNSSYVNLAGKNSAIKRLNELFAQVDDLLLALKLNRSVLAELIACIAVRSN